MNKIIKVFGKISDSGYYQLINNANEIIGEVDGYLPKFLSSPYDGDYIEMSINLNTGMILNWKTPRQEDLNDFFNLGGKDES